MEKVGQGEPEEDTEGDGRELGKSVRGSAWFQRNTEKSDIKDKVEEPGPTDMRPR